MTRLSYSDFRKLLLIHAAALADGRLDDAQDLEQVAETIDGQFDASWSDAAATHLGEDGLVKVYLTVGGGGSIMLTGRGLEAAMNWIPEFGWSDLEDVQKAIRERAVASGTGVPPASFGSGNYGTSEYGGGLSANRHFVVGEQEPEEAFTGAGGNEGQGRPLEFGDQLDGPNVLDGRINSAGPVTIAIDPDSEDIVEIRKNLSEIVRQVRSNNLFMVEGGDEAERNLMQLEAAIMLLKVREIDPNLWLGMVRPAFSYLSKKIAENALNYAIDVIIAATVSLAVRHFAG